MLKTGLLMSLFKTIAIACLMLALQACGFAPLYQSKTTGQSTGTTFDTIFVRTIPDRVGQELRNHLLNALTPKGRPSQPEWELSVKLSESIEKISVEQTSFSTRANLKLVASFSLEPTGDNDRDGVSGSVGAISSYNILDSEYATLVAERDARSRAVIILGNDIRRQLATWLNRQES